MTAPLAVLLLALAALALAPFALEARSRPDEDEAVRRWREGSNR